MSPRSASVRPVAAAAALARIADHERRTDMAVHETTPESQARAMWALGDYHAFAKRLIWEVGADLAAACAPGPGRHVLDVAAGTGNFAIRAAQAGAAVVASDLTPEQFEAGRREAGAQGVELEWVEADAQALPFEDAAFDVVGSVFGAIFAPDHRAVARELLRVCRPGGTIAMANFTPGGTAGAFFGLMARHAPPSPGESNPLLWGTEQHLRELFGPGISSLEVERRAYVERAADPAAYCRFFERTFGPVIALRASLAGDPERAGAFDEEFLAFATSANRGPDGGPAEYPYEYLRVLARRAG